MSFNHIHLHGREIGITVFRVLQRFFRMGKTVKFVLDVFVLPIIKIIIVKKSATHKKIEVDSCSVALMVLIAKISDLDRMGISACFYMMAKRFHFFEFFGVDDALHQMIKFGIDLHKNTFRIFFYSLSRRRADYSTQKYSDHRGDRCYEKGEKRIVLI